MDNTGRATEVGGYGREIGEGRGIIKALDRKRCASTEEGFGGTENTGRRGSTP